MPDDFRAAKDLSHTFFTAKHVGVFPFCYRLQALLSMHQCHHIAPLVRHLCTVDSRYSELILVYHIWNSQLFTISVNKLNETDFQHVHLSRISDKHFSCEYSADVDRVHRFFLQNSHQFFFSYPPPI